ncbi:MAG: hypothetical protein HXX16_08060 [Bacteroidales bacterium]|nr:hypothetical protein [Bacteroidales bacterium]
MKTAAESNILDEVKKIVSSTLKIPFEKLDVDADFESFGMDSIIAMELMTNLSKKMNISVTPAQFTEVNNIRDLAVSIERNSGGNSIDNVADESDMEDSLPDNLPEPEHKFVSQAPVNTSRSVRNRPSRDSRVPFQKVLDNIHENYSIDLSYRKFRSIDEIADTLLSNHFDEILQHYNISNEPVVKESKVERSNRTKREEIKAQTQEIHDIAIVGISCNFPDAPNAKIFWDNLIAQKNSIREIPKSRWNWEDYYGNSAADNKTVSKWAALIENVDRFDAQFFNITPEEALFMDPQERLLMQEVYKAFQDGGIDPVKLKGTNTGVFMSYEYSEYEHYLRKNIHRIPVGPNGPFFSSSSPSYYLSNRISFAFDFFGPSESINVNCAGSAVAINRAYYSLLNRESDVAVVGGVSLNLFADDYITLSKYGMLSPNGTCAVFDDNANGFTRGEGAASVILKRLDDAERDNNKIYGVIKCSHQKNRGNARFLQEIKIESFTSVINDCYEKVSIKPETIRYIEVDGYATKWGDSFEFDGIKNVFKKSEPKGKYCAIGSAKGNIGNLESVNGLVSVIKIALSLYNKKFPATISKKTVSSFIDINNQSHPLYIADSPILFDTIRGNNNLPIRAGVNSFADSGVNVHILMEEYNSNSTINNSESPVSPQLFILSAKNHERLKEYVEEYINYLTSVTSTNAYSSFINMIYTLQIGRGAMDERLAIIASSYTELIEKLNQYKKSGIQEKKGVFQGNIKQAKDNPLISLFTKDIAGNLFEQSLQAEQWQQIAQLWISGVAIPWEKIWKGNSTQPVSLPFYPFAKERYWIDTDDNGDTAVVANELAQKIADKNAITKEKNESSIQAEWFFFMTNGDIKDSSSMQPVEKIELFLKQEIALVLQKPIQEIEIEQHFLDLGLDSIGIGTFASNTMNLLGINMSPSIIFVNPDIKKLAEYLFATYPEKIKNLIVTKDEAQAKNASDSTKLSSTHVGAADLTKPEHVLIPMQTSGKKRPIFAITPGGNGTTLAFQHLILSLGMEQPFYGIEAVGLEGETPAQNSIEEMAKINVDAVQAIQAKGPYRFLGLSNGGMIAFEMAKILLEQGEKIESLTLLDCFSPMQPVIDMIDEIVGVFKGKFLTPTGKELDLNAEQLKKIPENERFDYLYNVITSNGFSIPKMQFASTYNTARVMDLYCRAYKPSKLQHELNVLLFRATEGYMEGYNNLPDDYGWNQLLINPISISRIDANHFSITDKKPSQEIAQKILSMVERRSPKKK